MCSHSVQKPLESICYHIYISQASPEEQRAQSACVCTYMSTYGEVQTMHVCVHIHPHMGMCQTGLYNKRMAVCRLESQGLIVQKAYSLKTGELGGSMMQLVFNVPFFFLFQKAERKEKNKGPRTSYLQRHVHKQAQVLAFSGSSKTMVPAADQAFHIRASEGHFIFKPLTSCPWPPMAYDHLIKQNTFGSSPRVSKVS